ncbi:MAG: class I SAM-dependent methyltransferase [Rhodoferax sp.]|nr:class I SAM-dependent methyltransferase [Rhodoferax sp.]
MIRLASADQIAQAGQTNPIAADTKQARPQRFLSASPMAYQSAIAAAQTYVTKLQAGDVLWLHSKPYDPNSGHPQYFRLMFDLLNILQVMAVPAGGRVLEIGSGPGWVTEILLMLGFTVDALEPAADLIDIAEERCSSLAFHYRHAAPPKVRFHQATLEEVKFQDESFDGVLFFDVLHHVVDERLAMEKCLRFLKPGGCVGVVEGAWQPGARAMEQALIAEMATFGTLENPFTQAYLDEVLETAGFVEIRRYGGVNGFFTAEELAQPARNLASSSLASANHLTARRPDRDTQQWPGCADPEARTELRLRLRHGGIDPASRSAELVVHLQNLGQTLLEGRVSLPGHVRLALRRGTPGAPDGMESLERLPLPEAIRPGQAAILTLAFTLPDGAPLDGWVLDLVAEGLFWFSARGTVPCPVPCLT